ncbi:DegT/DnrJ/EryC1/StrS family aminotransferase [Flavobacterium rhizosphaerae]|uniref:Aminotransferase class I/II-fold pyridoxal phosphate-dependent enzyme n=1 Tax=Flavobacterium rhizosphaerae TaxID=3163298 RepID=A0ABW8YZP9_9FLAO
MAKPQKIWLSPPHMGDNEQKYIQQAFEDNWIAPVGPSIIAFEKDLELYLGNRVHVAALNSGTAALHLGLIMLGIQPGDEVFCQSFTFSASANPILYAGAIPVFIDSEPESWSMCPDCLETALKTKAQKGKLPKAIIVVHLYGMPCKIKDIMYIAGKYGVPVLEDSAEALGSRYGGEYCGTFGDIGILSFNGNKIITTSGGGALITKRKEFKERAVHLATQAKKDKPYYEHDEIGYNYRMSNIAAAIGRGQMEVLDTYIAKRRKNHAAYADFFSATQQISVLEEYSLDCYSNFWLTTITVNPSEDSIVPENIRVKLSSENIESRPLWKPMHLQPVFKDAEYVGGDVAEKLFNTGLCLPSGSGLTDTEKERIFSTLREFLF